jgi:hypothetical protein
MPVILNTVTEALKFIDSFDGNGMISTDEADQLATLRGFDLIDDTEQNTPTAAEAAPEPVVTAFELFRQKVSEIMNELKNFAADQMRSNPARTDEDFWEAFNDEIDVQFCVNDDESHENFNKYEVWAYPIVEKFGNMTTDASEGVLIAVYTANQ